MQKALALAGPVNSIKVRLSPVKRVLANRKTKDIKDFYDNKEKAKYMERRQLETDKFRAGFQSGVF